MTKLQIHYLLFVPGTLCLVTGLAILFACLMSASSGNSNQPDYQPEPLGWRKWRSDLDTIVSRFARYRRQHRQWRDDSFDESSGNPINIRLLLAGIVLVALGAGLLWLNWSA